MFEVGERVKWRSPLDADYSYGTVLEIKGKFAVVSGTGYYTGKISEIHTLHIETMERGGGGYGARKKSHKRSATKRKLQGS